ncbi:MAG TPA: TIR domain-containing protein [Longimicrobium sp.]|jgi:hypothetical protein
MAKRIFISYSFRDAGLRNDLVRFFKDHLIEATPTFIDDDISGAGDEGIKARIRAQMKECAGLLVLAGEKAHNSPWIQYEAGVANEFGIRKAAVRHPARSGGLPNAHVGMPEVAWDAKQLAQLVASW